MRAKTLLTFVLLAPAALATRMWTPEEFERYERGPVPAPFARPESLIYGPRRYNYLERVKLMCDFVASYQVSDSTSPDYGGIIESEHQPTIIETDNTQEAIWVWSRWYELTGRDDYSENIRRAWLYVLSHPAFEEHGGQPSSIWYAVWNCGLGFMAEARYRHTYADSSFLPYADSCRLFYVANPLDTWNSRDNFVTSQSSGMAYPYALEMADTELRDTALARGARVRDWIEADAAGRLATGSWAMSGGTALWGVANTVCRDDTVAGRQWVETYAESLPGFYPGGTWNCSHNIWLANAYRACAEVGHDEDWWLMHHYLVDTLLALDTDRDGGIPATWTDPPTQDQTWVSTYMDFMGFDVFVTPTYDNDVSALEFVSPGGTGIIRAGDTVDVLLPLANVGLEDAIQTGVTIRGNGYNDVFFVPLLPFLGIDTFTARPLVTTTPGTFGLEAVTSASGDFNPLNDSSRVTFKVYGDWTLDGTLTDSATGLGIHAWMKLRIRGDSEVWDSCETDRSGNFTLTTIDTLVTLTAETWPPYYDRSWDLAITGDTTVDLVTPTAQVMVVNNDPAGDYEEYYTAALDTIGVTHCTCPRWADDEVPWSVIPDLQTPTLIWYSGDGTTGTVPPDDRDSLMAFAPTGLNLLLTGQNVAAELAGTDFLEQFVGCRFDSSGWPQFFVFGNSADSFGARLGGTATAGGNGASNQTSRDIVSPLGGAARIMEYDTTDDVGAATAHRQDMANVLFLGFGFEAVNQPQSRPDFRTRPELMSLFLEWFGISGGIAGPPAAPPARIALSVRPNPFAGHVTVRYSLPTTARARLQVFDLSGRRVATLVDAALAPGEYQATWHARNDAGRPVPRGVYFCRLTAGSTAATTRLLLVR